MTIYGKTTFEEDLKDVIDLCSKWWKDSLFYKTYDVSYNVDVDLFKNLNIAGLLIYTIGREDGKAISCYVGVKTPYMFNSDVLAANEIVWCVDKDHRSFKQLVGLSNAIERLMEEENIDLWNLNVSNEEQYDNVGRFLENKEYKLMDNCFSKFRR